MVLLIQGWAHFSDFAASEEAEVDEDEVKSVVSDMAQVQDSFGAKGGCPDGEVRCVRPRLKLGQEFEFHPKQNNRKLRRAAENGHDEPSTRFTQDSHSSGRRGSTRERLARGQF